MPSCCGCCAIPSPSTTNSSPLILPSQSRPAIRRRLSSRSSANTHSNPQTRTGARDAASSRRLRDAADDPFDETPHRKAARSYAALIGAHCRSRRWRDVLSVLASMAADGATPDRFLLPKILKACSEMRDCRAGAAVHGYIITSPLEVDVFVGNSLVDMYAKCGDVASAHAVFDRMPERDVVSWTALVNAYADAGLLDEAEVIFQSMRENGVRPDLISWNTLISGFARNGETEMALCFLEDMRRNGIQPGANTWNGVISGLVQNGCFEDAVEVFREMCLHEKPNAVTIASILPACSGIGSLNLGQELHSHVIKNGTKTNVFVCGSLINMYIKCGKNAFAERAFQVLENRNETVWNTMIAAYVDDDKMSEALCLLDLMQKDGLVPDLITYNTFLAAYARMGERDKALKFMSEIFQKGLKPNIVSINALISGFHHSSHNKEALDLFRLMQLPHLVGSISYCLPVDIMDVLIQPNDVTITSVLSACADLKLHHSGKEVHGFLLRNNFESNVFVSSALVDMYGKCCDMSSATKVFHGIKDKNVVSWNVLMAGHNHNEHPEAALKLFVEMLEQDFCPNSITMMILLLSCSNTMALRVGRELHSRIEKDRPDGYPVGLLSALINMYAKCGSIEDAKLVFDCAVEKDLAVWNAMMAGYSLHRMTTGVLDLFRQMEQSGIRPDHITFTAILSACNREGFIEEGRKYFDVMEDVYGVSPTLEHFTCVVDILGTAGLLEESIDLIRTMPFEPDACMWTTLLKACRVHSNFEIGERAARALLELEPYNASNHIMLSNIFAMAGLWDSSLIIKNALRDQGLKMVNACSWIEIGKAIHSFKAGDRSHPQMEKILNLWNKLAANMSRDGYVPQNIVFCDQGEADPFICYHTEKLAVCLGIISLHGNSPIRVLKNVHMCIDCHSSIKFISKLVEREIFIRDGSFYHHFKDGACSCGDRW
ncbi:pentatricopeptide repeat-containing protein [Canna indica]|uniref:Pentatricopeptide repeat-containing protein n=1 Tax=Canna indica TaxID=4628 RepID=A0AAQ3QMH4_9LILI|nr:pentatricopeptide repeat-containing protein [Canna indica]